MADKRKQIVLKEIISLIDSIKDHADDLEWDNHIPQIELEYISSKIAKLYEKSIVLNFLNTFEDEFVSAKSQTVKQHLNMDHQIEKMISVETTTIENDLLKIENPIEEKQESIHVKEIIEDDINNEPVVIEHEYSKTVEPIVTEDNESLIGSTQIIEEKVEVKIQESNNVAPEIEKPVVVNKIIDPKKPPIANLKSAISINQRLQYINNLFKGNGELMNQCIDELNNLNSLTEASAKLDEITNKMGWDREYELYLGFKELVERRYS